MITGEAFAEPPATQFSLREIHHIKSLSSQHLDTKNDPSNRVSGNPAAIAFGSTLFFEPQLSGDGTMACSSCHKPDESWANHQAMTSLRPQHTITRHVPSLWGVKYNRWYFWDGRTDSLWSQALKPIENIAEMAGSRTQIAHLIINKSRLRQQYEALFGAIPSLLLAANLSKKAYPIPHDPQQPAHIAWQQLPFSVQQAINTLFSNIGKSIAAFEETLLANNTLFDQFSNRLKANSTTYPTDLLSPAAIRGLKLFINKAGCINCHSGANFSDGEFHHPFLKANTESNDFGRYDAIKTLLSDPFNGKSTFSDAKSSRNKLDYVYQNIEFRGQFKTPSLRNIAHTYPYMHTGEFKRLRDVLNYYNSISKQMNDRNKHQEILLKSLALSTQEINDLVVFLTSLSDIKQ